MTQGDVVDWRTAAMYQALQRHFPKHRLERTNAMSDIHCTTRFCSKCQTETERTSSRHCKPCKKAANAVYHAANIETIRAAKATYTAANIDKIRTYQTAYRKTHKTASVAWYALNPEKRKATQAAYYVANRARAKVSNAAYHAANPGARRVAFQNYEAKKRSNGGTLSRGLSEKLFKLQQGKCPCCNEPLGANYHLDHIMPIHLGGPNIDSNMQLLRQICNLQKSAQHPIDFMQGRGFLL